MPHYQITAKTSIILCVLAVYVAKDESDRTGSIHQSDCGRSSLCFQNKKKSKNALCPVSVYNKHKSLLWLKLMSFAPNTVGMSDYRMYASQQTELCRNLQL